MNYKKTIKYIEPVKGYRLDANETGCEYHSDCFACQFRDCKYALTEKRKEQLRKAAKTYRDKNKDKNRERLRIWREKQRLAKLLDQKRQDAEEKAITPLMS